MSPTTGTSIDELVTVAVPRRHYPLIIQTLARALASEAGPTSDPAGPGEHLPWTREEIGRLRHLARNATVRTLMDMTCASPGTRVTFKSIYERAERTYPQARADLAGLTRLIHQRFKGHHWPVHVVQLPGGALAYDADPAIAQAWNASRD